MAAGAKRASWSVGELVGGRAVRIVAEREADLPAQQRQGLVADPADDRPYLSPVPVRRLRREDDEQAQEVRMTLQRANGGRDDPGQVLGGTTGTPIPLRQVGEETLGPPFHDGEQDPILRAVVVVDGAQRDPRIQQTNQRLYRAYLLKEQLRALYQLEDPVQAPAHLAAWIAWAARSKLNPFVRLARTLRRHRDGILAAIRLGLTNARLEGLRNEIGLLCRRSYGFHSPQARTALIYLCCAGITITPPHR